MAEKEGLCIERGAVLKETTFCQPGKNSIFIRSPNVMYGKINLPVV